MEDNALGAAHPTMACGSPRFARGLLAPKPWQAHVELAFVSECARQLVTAVGRLGRVSSDDEYVRWGDARKTNRSFRTHQALLPESLPPFK